jgi:hypothetical protein
MITNTKRSKPNKRNRMKKEIIPIHWPTWPTDDHPTWPRETYEQWLRQGSGTKEQQARYRKAIEWYDKQ